MTNARWAVLMLAVVGACADTDVPTDVRSPSLAKPGADGVRILDLGTLGGRESRAIGMNTPTGDNRLLIVGQSNSASGAILPAYWYVDPVSGSKSIAPLSLPVGQDYRQGWGFDVNGNEQIAGFAYKYQNNISVGSRALIWSAPVASAAVIPGMADIWGGAPAINVHGHAAGSIGSNAMFFDGATITNLGSLGAQTEAYDVNDHDVVVGADQRSATKTEPYSSHAFVSSPSGPPVRLPDWGGNSAAMAINNEGVIVGHAMNTAGQSRAVRWTRSTLTGEYVIEDLGLTNARAWDINSIGEIVGSFVGSRGERGFYQSAGGTTKELPILSWAGIAYAINESAQIVGISWVRNTYSHAVLWTGVR